MIRKVFIYGLAFGSLSASMVLIMYLNKLYLHHNMLSAIPVLGNLIIFGVGVYLLVKSLMKIQLEKPLTLGKALFMSLIMAVVAAGCNIAAYQHVQFNEKAVFTEYKNIQLKSIETRVRIDFAKLSQKDQNAKIAEYRKNFEENLNWSSYAMVEMQMFLSIALIVTLLVYIANQKKQ
jgi:hypothetical protein